MKNYYIQISELNLAKERLHTLEEKKQMYLRRVTSTVSVIKDVVIVGGKAPDKMNEYVIKCEEIDKEIFDLKEEIRMLEDSIKTMDKYLDASKDKADIERMVFIHYYKEGKTPSEIAHILPCGIATVYRKLSDLKKKMKHDNK